MRRFRNCFGAIIAGVLLLSGCSKQEEPRKVDLHKRTAQTANDEVQKQRLRIAVGGMITPNAGFGYLDSRTCQIGRMATAADVRSRGVGAMVLEALERMAALRGVAEIVLHAQLPAEAFYGKRGYVTEGAPFKDQGVPHVLMRKRLVR